MFGMLLLLCGYMAVKLASIVILMEDREIHHRATMMSPNKVNCDLSRWKWLYLVGWYWGF